MPGRSYGNLGFIYRAPSPDSVLSSGKHQVIYLHFPFERAEPRLRTGMDLLHLLNDYKHLKNLVLESSQLKPWYWRRRGLASVVRETVEKYRDEYRDILGQVFFTRLTFQDFYLYHYVVREEFDLTTTGHQVACVSFVVYVLERWADQELRFGRDYMLDSLCFPLWQRVREELKWQTRHSRRVVRYRRRDALTPLSNSAQQMPPRPSIPFPFLGGRSTEPLLPSFRLCRESGPEQCQSPLPALVVYQQSQRQQQQVGQKEEEKRQTPPTVMIPTSKTSPQKVERESLDGETFMSLSSQCEGMEQLPPPLPPKLRQRQYLERVLEETEEQLEALSLTRMSSSSNSSGSSESVSSAGSQNQLCPGESSQKAPPLPPKCRRALQL